MSAVPNFAPFRQSQSKENREDRDLMKIGLPSQPGLPARRITLLKTAYTTTEFVGLNHYRGPPCGDLFINSY